MQGESGGGGQEQQVDAHQHPDGMEKGCEKGCAVGWRTRTGTCAFMATPRINSNHRLYENARQIGT
jgi:hypothetical protein